MIRETLKSVFGGVGVYTVLEIFFKAGKHLHILATALSRSGIDSYTSRHTQDFPPSSLQERYFAVHLVPLASARRSGNWRTNATQHYRASPNLLRMYILTSMYCSTFLEPNYAGYVLAPSKQQRLKYSYRLHVFGKKRARMSERMKRLCLRYEVSHWLCIPLTLQSQILFLHPACTWGLY